MSRLALAAAFLGGISATAPGQVVAPRPPVIDLHVHSTSGSPQEQVARMNELNIRYIWLAALAPDLPAWISALPEGRFQALILPCPGGRAPPPDDRVKLTGRGRRLARCREPRQMKKAQVNCPECSPPAPPVLSAS